MVSSSMRTIKETVMKTLWSECQADIEEVKCEDCGGQGKRFTTEAQLFKIKLLLEDKIMCKECLEKEECDG